MSDHETVVVTAPKPTSGASAVVVNRYMPAAVGRTTITLISVLA
jgi:hypothetical protein